jgi:hypothetical protein
MRRVICGIVIVVAVAGGAKRLDGQCNLKETVVLSFGNTVCYEEGADCVELVYEPPCERCQVVDISKNKNCIQNDYYAATWQLMSGSCMCAGTSHCTCYGVDPVGEPHAADCWHTTTTECPAP